MRRLSRPSPTRKPGRRVRPNVELLEDRITPATLVADPSVPDGQPGSLRWCIIQSNKDKTTTPHIIVLSGHYQLTIPNVGGAQENGCRTGDLDFTNRKHTVTLRGSGEGGTVIEQTVADRVLHLVGLNVSGSGAKVNLENLTVTGGEAQDNGHTGDQLGDSTAQGGGVLSMGGVLKANRVTIQDCDAGTVASQGAGAAGGGLYAGGIFGSATLTGVTVKGCRAIGGTGATGASGENGTDGGSAQGGGVWVDGVPATFTACRILNNQAIAGAGGTGGDGGLVVGDAGNGGNGGGSQAGGLGYFTFGFFSFGLSISDCTINGNQVSAGAGGAGGDGNGFGDGFTGGGGGVRGGGLLVSTADTGNQALTITRSTIANNTLTGGAGGSSAGTSFGAGAYLEQTGFSGQADRINISNSTFANNTNNLGSGIAAHGGGIAVVRNGFSAGPIALTNVTVANNSTALQGGGIALLSGRLDLLNVTVAANTANVGGGIFVGGGAEFNSVNSLFGDNTATIGPDAAGFFNNPRNNLLEDGAGAGGIADGVDDNIVGEDPLLQPLGNNGGPTRTIELQAASPALGAGDPAAVAGIAFDQRGTPFNRVFGPKVDIGALEHQPLPNAVNVRIATGADTGLTPTVRILDGLGNEIYSFLAYPDDFRGGVRTAMGDVDGDSIPDVIVAPGAGLSGGAEIKVYSGADLFNGIETVASFKPFDATSYEGELFVAAGDVDTSTPEAEIVVANTDLTTGGPVLRVYNFNLDMADFTMSTFSQYLADLQPFGAAYKGGVRVAVGDVNGDGKADVIGAQSVKGTLVRAYDGTDLSTLVTEIKAASTPVAGGFFVAAGNVGGDVARQDIIVGLGKGPVSRITIYEKSASATTATKLASGLAFTKTFKGGARVAAVDYDGDGLDDVATTGGAGNERRVRFLRRNNAGLALLDQFFAELPPYTKGLFVASALVT